MTKGADIAKIRRHGRWNSDRLTQSYLSPISRVCSRILAGFPKDRGSYFLEKDAPVVLANLAKEVFPEVEIWEVRIEGTERQL